MANTTNYNWETPDDTDLVKDGAAAIRTLGNSIDTSFVDLKGGTTDQVLAKNSGTDLDFKWVAQDDSNAIQNAIVDAKGDLISATAADTPARLAVGANDTVLTADSSTSTGLKWAAPASGGMTVIASGSLSGTAVNLTSIPGTYNDLRLVVRAFRTSTDNFDLRLRFNNDSNTRYHNTSSTQAVGTFNSSSVYIATGQDNGTTDSICVLDVFDYANTTHWKSGLAQSGCNDANTSSSVSVLLQNIFYNQTGAITEINLISTGTAFANGTYVLYGVK
jgi:hypothetical protein